MINNLSEKIKKDLTESIKVKNKVIKKNISQIVEASKICTQSIKNGGKIISEIPCANDPLITIFDIPVFEKFYWSIAHHYYYTPKSLTYILDKMGLKYQLIPEQRYDLSNHIVWMTEGKPGGQGRFNSIFSSDLINQYQNELKNKSG